MRSSIIAASAACALFAFGTAASAAQANDWVGNHLTVGIGAASGKDHGSGIYDPLGLTPKGTVLNVAMDHRFVVADHIVLGVEMEGQVGNLKDSGSRDSCTLTLCGYDETETGTLSSRWSASMGGSVGHPLGNALISLTAGLRASDYSREWSYRSGGFYPDSSYKTQGYMAGYYYGARAEYLLTERLSAGLEWRHSELMKFKDTYNGWSDDNTYKENVVRAQLTRSW